MAILNPDHLIEQANQLIAPPSAGPPRQVNLRRAISSSYYAAFHAIITTAADEIVGVTQRNSREHALVMRSVNHKTIKDCCVELAKSTPAKLYVPYIPTSGFGPEILALAAVFPDLQEERHAADYDSSQRYVTADARGIVNIAASAVAQLRAAPAGDRKAFAYLILFPPKR